MSPLISVGEKEKSIVHDYVLKKNYPWALEIIYID